MKICTEVHIDKAYNFAEVNIDGKWGFRDRTSEFLISRLT
jgi:hypothetical protein